MFILSVLKLTNEFLVSVFLYFLIGGRIRIRHVEEEVWKRVVTWISSLRMRDEEYVNFSSILMMCHKIFKYDTIYLNH